MTDQITDQVFLQQFYKTPHCISLDAGEFTIVDEDLKIYLCGLFYSEIEAWASAARIERRKQKHILKQTQKLMVSVLIPHCGESITSGVIKWLCKDGDFVKLDQPLFDFETEKIVLTITALSTGKLKIIVNSEADVLIGQVVAEINPTVIEENKKIEVERLEKVTEKIEKAYPNLKYSPSMPPSMRRMLREKFRNLK